MIYMSYVSINCMSFYSFPANSHTYTPPASRSKLIGIVSIIVIIYTSFCFKK